jgi:NAD(P)-dependent dehydrogenase (short-subunit alcohol dehydrogenase family)
LADGPSWALRVAIALLSLFLYVWLRSRTVDPRGRVVLITGCDTGIGRATAALLAEIDGLIVVAACLTQDGRAALLRELAGARAVVHAPLLDVTDARNIARVVEQVRARDACGQGTRRAHASARPRARRARARTGARRGASAARVDELAGRFTVRILRIRLRPNPPSSCSSSLASALAPRAVGNAAGPRRRPRWAAALSGAW